MAIHQLHIAHQPLQDRLLLRVSTTDGKEFRIWLTRRFTRVLWKALTKLIAADVEIAATAEEDAKEEVLTFKHQQAIQQTNFTKQYTAEAQERPLGDAPLLASRIKAQKKDDNTSMLSIHDERGQGVQLALNQNLLHSICKLLADTTKKAEWDLNLALAKPAKQKQQEDTASKVVH